MADKLWAIEVPDSASKQRVAVVVDAIESIADVAPNRIITMRSGAQISTEESYDTIIKVLYGHKPIKRLKEEP